jgi:hypothetical protein
MACMDADADDASFEVEIPNVAADSWSNSLQSALNENTDAAEIHLHI